MAIQELLLEGYIFHCFPVQVEHTIDLILHTRAVCSSLDAVVRQQKHPEHPPHLLCRHLRRYSPKYNLVDGSPEAPHVAPF